MREKTSKREIPQSWYHMPGPPFLMRQRSMYSLALSHTGGTPIMPQVNLFKQNSPRPNTTAPSRPGSAAYHPVHPFAFSDREPCLISQESNIGGVRQLSPDREKELGVRPHSASPSPPSPWPSVKHRHKKSKEEHRRSQWRVYSLVLTEGGTNACLVWILRIFMSILLELWLWCWFVSFFLWRFFCCCCFFFRGFARFFWVSIKLSFSSISKLE